MKLGDPNCPHMSKIYDPHKEIAMCEDCGMAFFEPLKPQIGSLCPFCKAGQMWGYLITHVRCNNCGRILKEKR